MARSERLTLLAGLLALTLLSWMYLARVADGMNAMTGNGGSARYMWLMLMGRWGPTQMALAFGMWVVMMVAMMMPSAAPMLFAFVRLGRTRPGPGSPRAIVAVFLLGYVLAWTIFSALATAAQWVLHESDVLTDAMVSTNRALDATLLLGAGIYQFLPLKTACLSKC
ncbi:MAG: metal-binding protein, partial [Acidobacteria bacterium]